MYFRKHLDVLAITFFGIVIHLLPFIMFGRDPLGYDGGFYRRYLIEPINFLHSVPGLGTEAIVPKITFDILKFLHLPADVVLYGSLIGLYAGATIALYFLVKKYAGAQTAFFAALFFTISPVQYFGYWCVLFKNAYGILLLVITALLIQKRSPWMYLSAALIVCTHQTTSVLFLVSLTVFGLINKKERARTTYLFCLTAALFIFFHYASIGTNLVSLPIASFLSWSQYLTLSIPFLILAFIGIRPFAKSARSSFLLSFVVASIMYPLLHLPFYQRIFLFTDLSLVIIAAYGIAFLLNRNLAEKLRPHTHLGKIIACGLLIVVCFIEIDRVTTLYPMVASDQLTELDQIDSRMPTGSYLLTDSPLAPWAEGFCHMHIIAPSILLDHHTKAEWIVFWGYQSLQEKTDFLNGFGKPLYTFLPEREQKAFLPDVCREKITEYISRYTCE